MVGANRAGNGSSWRPRRALVTGGAGFLGSHLCERLLTEGAEVVCIDDLSTGTEENVRMLEGHGGFTFVQADVASGLPAGGQFDAICHLASAASPVAYRARPVETLRAGSAGTLHCLARAETDGARFLLASTSEVYGNPEVHPQPETYHGAVDPTGPRSCYDEAKRFAEAAAAAYGRSRDVPVRIARIFNTIGPRMRLDDGRALPTFIAHALRGLPLPVHGDGSQTRSLCDVDDLVEGLWRLLTSDVDAPVNLGNPDERTILEVAELVCAASGVPTRVVFEPRPEGDPDVRRPDITRARLLLGWRPRVPLEAAVARAVEWFRERDVETAGRRGAG